MKLGVTWGLFLGIDYLLLLGLELYDLEPYWESVDPVTTGLLDPAGEKRLMFVFLLGVVVVPATVVGALLGLLVDRTIRRRYRDFNARSAMLFGAALTFIPVILLTLAVGRWAIAIQGPAFLLLPALILFVTGTLFSRSTYRRYAGT